jgi:hypothetical protein
MGLVFTLNLFILKCGPLESWPKDYGCTRLYALRGRKLWFEGCLKLEPSKASWLRCKGQFHIGIQSA